MIHPGERFRDLLHRVDLPHGMTYKVVREGSTSLPVWFLRVEAPLGVCNVSGKHAPWVGRKWRLSEYMTDTEVVATAFKAYITALEHEAREQFKFDGVPVFDSHTDVHSIVAMRKLGQGLDAREQAEA